MGRWTSVPHRCSPAGLAYRLHSSRARYTAPLTLQAHPKRTAATPPSAPPRARPRVYCLHSTHGVPLLSPCRHTPNVPPPRHHRHRLVLAHERTAPTHPLMVHRPTAHLAGTPRRYRRHAAIGTASMLAHGGVPITSKMISSSWCVARLPTGPSVAYDSSSVGVGGKSALVIANTGATCI